MFVYKIGCVHCEVVLQQHKHMAWSNSQHTCQYEISVSEYYSEALGAGALARFAVHWIFFHECAGIFVDGIIDWKLASKQVFCENK